MSRVGQADVDDLARMMSAMLMELWITRDRLAVVERLLEERNCLEPGEVEEFVPAARFEQDLAALRARMMAHVLGAPLAEREQGLDQILARAGHAWPRPSDAQRAGA
ncbi:hypothetical protein [Novosphingobium sp. BL-52-GroH]|uniref:hypothetical protein n=1 Tax=Novosphingobium sp. BL-52-GroH TaxID=3349877 RepID=UPI00384E5F9B